MFSLAFHFILLALCLEVDAVQAKQVPILRWEI